MYIKQKTEIDFYLKESCSVYKYFPKDTIITDVECQNFPKKFLVSFNNINIRANGDSEHLEVSDTGVYITPDVSDVDYLKLDIYYMYPKPQPREERIVYRNKKDWVKNALALYFASSIVYKFIVFPTRKPTSEARRIS